jgi:hypothetical protein
MSKTIWVTRDQVESARALVEISGGLDKVDSYIRKIATAEPAKRAHHDDRKAS